MQTVAWKAGPKAEKRAVWWADLMVALKAAPMVERLAGNLVGKMADSTAVLSEQKWAVRRAALWAGSSAGTRVASKVDSMAGQKAAY